MSDAWSTPASPDRPRRGGLRARPHGHDLFGRGPGRFGLGGEGPVSAIHPLSQVKFIPSSQSQARGRVTDGEGRRAEDAVQAGDAAKTGSEGGCGDHKSRPDRASRASRAKRYLHLSGLQVTSASDVRVYTSDVRVLCSSCCVPSSCQQVQEIGQSPPTCPTTPPRPAPAPGRPRQESWGPKPADRPAVGQIPTRRPLGSAQNPMGPCRPSAGRPESTSKK